MPAKASRFTGAKHVAEAQARHATAVDRVAAIGLAGDHGTLHRPGDRPDLCPKCNPAVDEMLLAGKVPAPLSRTAEKAKRAATRSAETRAKSAARKPSVRAKRKAAPSSRKRAATKPAQPTVTPAPERRAPRGTGKKRPRLLAVMCTDTERDVLYAAAERSGLAFSTWSRQVLLRAIGGDRS